MRRALGFAIALATGCGIVSPAFAITDEVGNTYMRPPVGKALTFSVSSTGWLWNASVYVKKSRTDTGGWVFTADKGYAIVTVFLDNGGAKSATIIVSTTGTVTGAPSNGSHGNAIYSIVKSGRYVVAGLDAWTKIRVDATNGATVDVDAQYRQGEVTDLIQIQAIDDVSGLPVNLSSIFLGGKNRLATAALQRVDLAGDGLGIGTVGGTLVADSSAGASGIGLTGTFNAAFSYILNQLFVRTPSGVALSTSPTGEQSVSVAMTNTVTGTVIDAHAISRWTWTASTTGATGATIFFDGSNDTTQPNQWEAGANCGWSLLLITVVGPSYNTSAANGSVQAPGAIINGRWRWIRIRQETATNNTVTVKGNGSAN